ncbi:MAG: sugar kinase [Marinosulfonomonas sp.]
MVVKVACIGEAMVELSLKASDPQHAKIGFAGDTLNTAIYLKRSAPALQVSFVTRLGQDSFSSQMLDFIACEEIDTSAVTISDTQAVGLYAITTDEAGERSFAYWRGQSAAKEMFQQQDGFSFQILEEFDVLYLSAITLAILDPHVRDALIDWLPSYKAKTGGRVVFDSNYRPALWRNRDEAQAVIARMWRETDIAVPSVDDEMEIYGDASDDAVIERLRGYGIRDGALKRGEAGPISLSETPGTGPYPAATDVVDTTSAGDSFNGGYLGEILSGASQPVALCAGHNLAAKVVGVRGAIIPRDD